MLCSIKMRSLQVMISYPRKHWLQIVRVFEWPLLLCVVAKPTCKSSQPNIAWKWIPRSFWTHISMALAFHCDSSLFSKGKSGKLCNWILTCAICNFNADGRIFIITWSETLHHLGWRMRLSMRLSKNAGYLSHLMSHCAHHRNLMIGRALARRSFIKADYLSNFNSRLFLIPIEKTHNSFWCGIAQLAAKLITWLTTCTARLGVREMETQPVWCCTFCSTLQCDQSQISAPLPQTIIVDQTTQPLSILHNRQLLTSHQEPCAKEPCLSSVVPSLAFWQRSIEATHFSP